MKTQPKPGKSHIRVLVADSQLVVREGVKALLQMQPDLQVAGEAATGKEAIKQFLLLRPDVLLLDMRMPLMGGPEVIRAIVKRDPAAKVIALSTDGGDEDIYQALKAGAKAFLSKKDVRRDQILESIRAVYHGRPSISPEVGSRLALRMAAAELTKREIDVLKLIAAGKSNKEIGTLLGIAGGTAKIHTGRILKKLGARRRTDAVRLALERGVVRLNMA